MLVFLETHLRDRLRDRLPSRLEAIDTDSFDHRDFYSPPYQQGLDAQGSSSA